MKINSGTLWPGSAGLFAAAVSLASAAYAEAAGGKPAQDPGTAAQAGYPWVITQAGADSGNPAAVIRQAFTDLGMADERAACFGEVLAESLSPADQERALRLVSNAATAGDVKSGVITGGPGLIGGFAAADAACPEGMGS